MMDITQLNFLFYFILFFTAGFLCPLWACIVRRVSFNIGFRFFLVHGKVLEFYFFSLGQKAGPKNSSEF